MNDSQKKAYIAWMNDAHAMEEGLVKILEKQVSETEGQPVMQAKLREHLEETKRHAELVRGCLSRHGEEPSTGKDIMSKMGAYMEGIGMSLADDALVKNVHSSYAAEHFEIASYTVLKAAAEECGDMETASVCDTILVDEVDMSEWLYSQIPIVTLEYLRMQE